MADTYTTGPVNIYLGIGGGVPITDYFAGPGNPVHLGTCEQAPKRIRNPEWSPLMNDEAGQMPYDFSYQGEICVIAGALTKFNPLVLKAAQSRPRHFSPTPGTISRGDIGSLMIREGLAFNVWLDFPYYRKPAYAGGVGGVVGERFLAGFMQGPDELEPGTKINREIFRIVCIAPQNPANGDFVLWDNNMTGIPLVPPTGPNGV